MSYRPSVARYMADHGVAGLRLVARRLRPEPVVKKGARFGEFCRRREFNGPAGAYREIENLKQPLVTNVYGEVMGGRKKKSIGKHNCAIEVISYSIDFLPVST